MRKQTEHELQKSIIKYMKLQHPAIFINGSLGGIYIKHHSKIEREDGWLSERFSRLVHI